MATENPSLRLGDLLTSAGLLKPTDLREAMMIARQQQLPVGRVLIMNGYLSEAQLQSAVQAQSMVKDGVIDLETAISALDLVANEHITLDESLVRMGWTMSNQTITNKLGEFLVEAELVAPADIHYALEQCREIGLPLGRVLVVTGYLTEEMLTNSLNAQVLVRDGRLTREQAVHGLRAALERQISLEESLHQSGMVHSPTATRMRLGELLLGAGLIDEANLMSAVEIGLVTEKLIGQVLLEQGMVTAEVLDNSLIFQAMVAQGEAYSLEAIRALQKSVQSNLSAQDALAAIKEPTEKHQAVPPGPVPLAEPLGFYQFLQLGGMITPQDVERALHTSARDTEMMAQMLLFANIMPGQMIDAAKEALSLINLGILTIEQSMIALKVVYTNGVHLRGAFQELNWDVPDLTNVLNHAAVAYQPTAPQTAFEPTVPLPMAIQEIPQSQQLSAEHEAPYMPPQTHFSQSEFIPEQPTVAAPAQQPYADQAPAPHTASQTNQQPYQQQPQQAQHTASQTNQQPYQQHAASGAFPVLPSSIPIQNNAYAEQAQSGALPVIGLNHLPSPNIQNPDLSQTGGYQQASTTPKPPPIAPYPQQALSGSQQMLPPQAPQAPPQASQAQFAQSQSGSQQGFQPTSPQNSPQYNPQGQMAATDDSTMPAFQPTASQNSPQYNSQNQFQTQSQNQHPLEQVMQQHPGDDVTLSALPVEPVVPVISVPRASQAINPWAAKTQAPPVPTPTAPVVDNFAEPQQQPAPASNIPPSQPVVPAPAQSVPPPQPTAADVVVAAAAKPAEEEPKKRKRLNDLMPKAKK